MGGEFRAKGGHEETRLPRGRQEVFDQTWCLAITLYTIMSMLWYSSVYFSVGNYVLPRAVLEQNSSVFFPFAFSVMKSLPD